MTNNYSLYGYSELAVPPVRVNWLSTQSMFEFYIAYEYWFAAVQLGLAMLGMGATLRIRDFAAVTRNPRGILVGITLQLIDNTAINIEATVRNGNLGLLIKASLFPAALGVSDPIGDDVLFTVLAYGGAALRVGVGLIYLHRFRNRNETVQYPL